MKRVGLILKTMFSRRWIVATIIVILGMLLMIRLSIWQFNRLEERRVQNAALSAVLEAEALPLTDELFIEDIAELKDREVVGQGAFDFEEQVILLVQNWSGNPGVHLLTPFVLEGTNTAVFVDRGWVPQSDVEAADLAKYDEANVDRLEGFVALSQPPPRYGNADAEPTGPQSEVYRVDVEMLQAQMPYDLLPFYVLQASAGNEAPPFRSEPEIDLSEGPHLSYAIQWIFFTIILGVGYFVLLNKRVQESQTNPVASEPPSVNIPNQS